ncbi:MAG: hypothetical protein COZ46_08015 [Verrucomicrobia bacterium CG_4_10_14_3_um_filter_43_23]|nr:MAG: hypothetical protein AUJ82_00780 [Verrucomicrobia bacterium CG1_02_43_26]PIP59434.1 MAG: hypothetical protein COX01_02335 [Verrucomicrobia bacterium CG22_combo_CG10-13_8_21_14_all_43_17]PIX57637.1 MAG: hypothetical protein COZ46_08015 [Verrucomicrobia bacterium CG_4_10_14_3_um_filter_43_23]PIY61426.1 MAG: hypothetical protein COY94_05410 [Verrucomicrobia bacterium CG_4_10_14_0_8_um_filter_43_34]PJA43786.1 MAG: hypothetical protein CO175_06000 [Verrucomicrobia bacterium CG_4_9_14_3_um_fi
MNKVTSKKGYHLLNLSKENDNSFKKSNFIKNETYKTNFIKSGDAINYVREELGMVSTNRKIEEYKLYNLLSVDGKVSQIDYDYAQIVNSCKYLWIENEIYNKFPSEVKEFEEKLGGKGCLLRIMINAKIHRLLNVGNCGPMATVAFDYLANNGVRGLELVYDNDIDHVFLIIGRDPNTDINDPANWKHPEKPFWVCDPWESKVWPGDQYIEDFDMYKSIREKEKYNFEIEASLPEGASWESLESLNHEGIQTEISSIENTVLKNCTWIKHSKEETNIDKESSINESSTNETIRKEMFLAAKKGTLDQYITGLENKGSSVEEIKKLLLQKNETGDTPLHIAAYKGHLEDVVVELMNVYFNVNQIEELLLQRNNNGDTPLGDARNYEHDESVKNVIAYLKLDGLSPERIQKLR